mmetsp:Transcript_4181/g.15523  ORF Transcript_4181/g.15523 Transcript_4181/m.15523 type:complete len:280 (+) Transcript_4181:107-946(+)
MQRGQPLAELDRDEGHVDVLTLLILAGHHDVEVLALGGDLHLRHRLHQVAHLLVHALLVLGEDVVVDEALAARHGVRGELLRLEPVEQLLYGEVALQDPAVPQAPFHVLEFEVLGRDRLGHGEERQREVGKGVAVRLQLGAVENLVKLEAHEAGGHGGGGRDGGDNSARDKLGLELINLRDVVVPGPHVGQARDRVHVEVGVVILLKLNHGQAVICRKAQAHLLELAEKILDDGLVVHAETGRSGCLGIGLDLDSALGLELRDVNLGDGVSHGSVVSGP